MNDPQILPASIRISRYCRPITLGTHVVFPLTSSLEPDQRPIQTAYRGMETGEVRVEELPGASVPELRADNRGTDAVYFQAGQLVVGGKQNRMFAVGDVLPPGTSRTLDVSCVEQGRWNPGSGRRFQCRTSPRSVSSRKLRRESTARMTGSRRAPDQQETWGDVRRSLADLGIRSSTQDLSESVALLEQRVDPEAIRALCEAWLDAGVSGLACLSARGELVALDYFTNVHLRESLVHNVTALAFDHGVPRTSDPLPAAAWSHAEDTLAQLGSITDSRTTDRGAVQLLDLVHGRRGTRSTIVLYDGIPLHWFTVGRS